MSVFDVIAFDADDTLWYYEHLYTQTQAKVVDLLNSYGTPEAIEAHLNQVELGNIHLYGYGIKSFALSLIEAAAQIGDGRLSSKEVQDIIDFAKEMMTADIQLIEGVPETISRLAKNYHLAIITKGDLFEQEAKISRSGLGSHFRYVEIVGQKSSENYARIIEKFRAHPQRFLMIGNSLRSDIIPVLELGGHAIYIPSENTWVHEEAEVPSSNQGKFYQIEHIGELPALIEKIEAERVTRSSH